MTRGRAMYMSVASILLLLGTIACTLPKPDEDRPESGAEPLGPPRLGTSCSVENPPCALSASPPGAADAAEGSSCCESLWLPGGDFAMGFNPADLMYPELEALGDLDHVVTVSGFYLDRFEITWGRFRTFAEQYAGPPPEGSGSHPHIEGSGWQAGWRGDLPSDAPALIAEVSGGAASEAPDPRARVARLSWFVAFAFCIWDGGRLPTEAEWEYAATGGDENRTYPWEDDPAALQSLAIEPPAIVEGNPATRGRFGHDDLAGGVREWVLDWFDELYPLEGSPACIDCANLNEGIGRVVRGAGDTSCCTDLESTEFQAAARFLGAPGVTQPNLGARCARDVDAEK